MIVASPDDHAEPGVRMPPRYRLGGRLMVGLDRGSDRGVAQVRAGLSDRSLALHPGKNLTERPRPVGRADPPAQVQNGLMVGYSDQAPFATPNHFPYTKTTSEFLGNFL